MKNQFAGFVGIVGIVIATLAGSFGVGGSSTVDAQDRARSGDGARRRAAEPAEPAAVSLPDGWERPFDWRSIGPANMGGRITSIAVNPKDRLEWWAATASGGLLHTTNNGVSFDHQFDAEATVSIGDVQVSPSSPSIIWIGTGEANPRNSVSWGNGVYKSEDSGRTWNHMGLSDSFQTGRIAIHPTNPDIVYVGCLGRLWGPNSERGLFKTTDGGNTWSHCLFIDDLTGVVEVQMDPKNPETLLVATYERQRDGFDTNDPAKKIAPGSGVYKTTDGGQSWRKITAGLPTGQLGRIGIDYFDGDSNIVYMVLESEKIGKEPDNSAFFGVTGEDADVGARLTSVTEDGPAEQAGLVEGDIVIALDDQIVHSYQDLLKQLRFFDAGETKEVEVSRDRESVFAQVTFAKRPAPEETEQRGRGRQRPRRSPFSGTLGGQRENLQDQQGKEGFEYGGIYRSSDGGENWTRVNSVNPRPMYYSQVRVDPSDSNFVYVLGTSLYRSKDGGKTFTPDGGRGGVHVDHHALWINPSNGRHMILGNDGGIYVTYDRMEKWDHHNHVAIGQFYAVTVGPRQNYKVYGGLQDNGSWGGPSRVRHGSGPTNDDWVSVGGGDGFVCWVDAEDPDLVYYESQNGGMGRRNFATGERARIRPRAPRNTRYRFNWKTPFRLSHHNSRIYYVGGNHVFRSLDRGDGLKRISPEITRTERGSATALAESPGDPDVLYVGTDDGALFMTRNGGAEWLNRFDTERPSPEEITGTPVSGPRASGQDPDSTPSDDSGERSRKPDDKPKSSALSDLVANPCWVSSIEASHAKSGRAYLTLDGHRSNDDRSYVFVTENFGETWRSLSESLPANAGSTKVIREDLKNPNLLYLGTEFGAYVSFDRGQQWHDFGLPTVAVHDFAVHPTVGEVVAATHGRSLWVLDVTPWRTLAAKALEEAAFLFPPSPAVIWRSEPRRGSTLRRFVGQNPVSGAPLRYALKEKANQVSIRILNVKGEEVQNLEGPKEAGLHRVVWNLRLAPAENDGNPRFRRRGRRAESGTYTVELDVDGKVSRRPLEIQIDPENTNGVWLEYEEFEHEGSDEEPQESSERDARVEA